MILSAVEASIPGIAVKSTPVILVKCDDASKDNLFLVLVWDFLTSDLLFFLSFFF